MTDIVDEYHGIFLNEAVGRVLFWFGEINPETCAAFCVQ